MIQTTKDIEIIFPERLQQDYFIELYEEFKFKNTSRGKEIGKDLLIHK